MDRVYSAEDALLQQVARPDRDEVALDAATKTPADAPATQLDRRTAFRLLERVNSRLGARGIALVRNATERLRVRAMLATSAARSWQPNGPQPAPDPELQSMIDGAVPNPDA